MKRTNRSSHIGVSNAVNVEQGFPKMENLRSSVTREVPVAPHVYISQTALVYCYHPVSEVGTNTRL